jgi:hypothetical protein
MNRLSLVVALLMCSACAPAEPEFTLADVPTMTREYTEVLQTVSDAATARAARPKIEALDEKYASLRQQGQNHQLKVPKDQGLEISKQQLAEMKLYNHELDRLRAIAAAAKELADRIPVLGQ